MTDRSVAIARVGDDHAETVAIVKWRATKKVESAEELKAALKRALTKWVKETPEGREAWEQTCEDFNIGDLALENVLEGNLAVLLQAEGIEELSIEIYDTANDWTYDTVLVNRKEVE